MCYMVVVAFPPSGPKERASSLSEPMHSWPSVYPGLSARMNNWQPHIVGTAQCSCDLFRPQSDAKILSLKRKYEKQGWSQAKVERALAGNGSTGFPGNLHPDLRRWLAASVQEAGEAYLLVHWDNATLEVPNAVRLSVAEFQESSCWIEEERLYYIQAVS
jgi:hypothetical protein